MSIWFLDDLSDWRDVRSLSVGSDSLARTVARVAIESDTGRVRIDIPAADDCTCFQDVRLMGSHAYIGYGSRLFVVNLALLEFVEYDMDGYFCSLYSAHDIESSGDVFTVLASSASELLAFDSSGGLIWKASGLGIDGVLVHGVSGNMICGDGEWDPPGGWQPFAVLQTDGEIIRNGSAIG
ncbi:MAG TPA: hypothetical protein VN089_25845 [Duganella sp.]|nr:hypothetical protein [Duganella sp.]